MVALRRRAHELRALRNFVANDHVLGRLATGVANLHDELGRLADLDLRRGKLLNHQRRLLRAFERAFARLAGALAGCDRRITLNGRCQISGSAELIRTFLRARAVRGICGTNA